MAIWNLLRNFKEQSGLNIIGAPESLYFSLDSTLTMPCSNGTSDGALTSSSGDLA